MTKYLVVAITLFPLISFLSYWAGYNHGKVDGEHIGWTKGYLMGKKVMEMVARG